MRIPPIAIPILGFHIIPLNGREMTVPLGSGLPSWSRTIAFIPIDRPLGGADMPETLGIGQISRGGGHFVDQPGLHIHTHVFFVPIPLRLLPLTSNPGVLVHRHLRQHGIVQLLHLLLPRLVTFFPQRRFGNQMRGIHTREYVAHQPGRFELFAPGGKQLGTASRPDAGADTGEQAGVGRGFRQGAPPTAIWPLDFLPDIAPAPDPRGLP